jgi:hypothetical protein
MRDLGAGLRREVPRVATAPLGMTDRQSNRNPCWRSCANLKRDQIVPPSLAPELS